MWASIIGAVAAFIPMIIKLILYIVDKKQNNEAVQKELLKFISEYERDFPTRVNDKYRDQLQRIKEKIKEDKEAYEKAQRELNAKIL